MTRRCSRVSKANSAPSPAKPIARSASGVRGCSSGAELYSVAMLLADIGILDRCELLGTDLRQAAIDRACNGSLLPQVRPGTAPTKMDRYIQKSRVVPSLRERITWRRANVLEEVEPGPWDAVLCRNLAIYLQPPAANRLWHRLASVLRSGGLLVLGKAERPSEAAGLVSAGPCIYRRDEL